ncbi:hypothetical protein [Paenibacillus sp. 1001270B_150601_E10]|uniref:hypothetical protein n=1 Tax=Paenibacillus sp. 1001270B_150601_E10 TaxID=2787079 RepID=UPI00189F57CD|nr:hypothetical protein [Paenibacillus sp. 1001270B_150601_E10]
MMDNCGIFVYFTVDHSIKYEGYRAFEFVMGEVPDFLAMADSMVSRAGTVAIHDFFGMFDYSLFIHKPLKPFSL